MMSADIIGHGEFMIESSLNTLLKVGALLLSSMLFLSACTWVKPSEGGAAVQVLAPEMVAGCERLGRATTMSVEKIAGVKRKASKLQKELTTIAQNRAAAMGGDAISPAGEVQGNEQTFYVYRCAAAL
ncbi:MAG: hypothetical protein ACI82A_001953 [Candidatus Azotimanducaceae bacterium]|jgi:hypothetical protein